MRVIDTPLQQNLPRLASADRPAGTPGYRRRHGLRRSALVATTMVALVLLSVSSAQADSSQVIALAGSVDDLLNNIRNWLMGILAGLATVALTVGGVRYVLGAGDPGEIEKAKSSFRAAGFGYVLAALAPLVVTVLKGIVGA